MQTTVHTLHGSTAGTSRTVTSLHFGTAGGRRALLQASLHADEIPPMLVAQHLRRRLTELEAAGQLRGEVVLVPACNPLGLSQHLWGRMQGRFEISSGQNFNRHYPDLAADAIARTTLTADGATNVRLLRTALHEALAARTPATALHSLRHTLLGLSIDADVVLDLHCDNDAVMHLYATPHHAEQAEQLGRCLQSPLGLLAEESGDAPFDEACSMVWPKLRALAGDAHPVPLTCFAATVEHRGETDVSHAYAAQDADALLRFLGLQGFISGQPAPAPFDCSLRPLAGCMPIVAPHAGVLVVSDTLGTEVKAGDVIAELIDPVSAESTLLRSPVDGLHFARELQRWAHAGQSVAKVAGHHAVRSGKLLSA
jgi:uncharacterized protein